jgi:hypothetical protein
VVAVEYFTKWIEAKPLVNIVAVGLKRFFWQNIICHFGVPRGITVDNAKQFDCHLFKDFCYQMRVEAAFASVYHPQSNRAVERANTLIFTAIKKILESQPKSKWAEELPRAVWSHNTSIYRATKFTPFSQLYGVEPVTPEEIKLHNARTKTEAIYSPTDADIPSIHTIQPMNQKQDTSSNMNHAPLTRSRAKTLQQHVTSLLAEFYNNITENVMIPKSSILVIIRFKNQG